jgi:hypothetical protein
MNEDQLYQAPIDWGAIELEYRAGLKPVAVIASEFGIHQNTIYRHAKADGWVRDLRGRIRARADQVVSMDAVPRGTDASETDVVQANAEVQANVIRAHRRDIANAKEIAAKLIAELNICTDNAELLEALATEAATEGLDGRAGAIEKQKQAVQRALGVGGRAQTLDSLARALKTLIGLEREAFSLNAEWRPTDTLSALSEQQLDERIRELDRQASAIAGEAGENPPAGADQSGVVH